MLFLTTCFFAALPSAAREVLTPEEQAERELEKKRQAAPVLVCTPDTLGATVARGETRALLLTIRNGGGQTLSWAVISAPSWVDVGVRGGELKFGEKRTLTLAVDPREMTTGTSEGVILVEAPGAEGSPVRVRIVVEVEEAPGRQASEAAERDALALVPKPPVAPAVEKRSTEPRERGPIAPARAREPSKWSGAVSGAYWMLETGMWETKAGSGGSALDMKADLGIDIPGTLVYEALMDYGRHRLRFNYWQVQGSGSMASSPTDYTFDTLSVTAGDQTTSSVKWSLVETVWEPIVVGRPNLQVRAIFGGYRIDSSMEIRNETTAGVAQVLHGDNWILIGGVLSVDIKPWLKATVRGQVHSDLMKISSNSEGDCVVGELSLMFGAPGGHGWAGEFGYRSFSTHYESAMGQRAGAWLDGLFARVLVRF